MDSRIPLTEPQITSSQSGSSCELNQSTILVLIIQYVNLYLLSKAVFKNERAWGILDSEQQRNLLAMVPKPPRSPTEGIEQDSQSSRNIILSNSAFQSDVRMFQEDLADGRLQPAWLEKAHIAMERRARGDFDAWKEEETEKFWGQKQKISYYVIAGESSKVSVETLVDAGRFQVGDVWLYERSIQIKGKGKIQIEKEAKVFSNFTCNFGAMVLTVI